MSNNRAAEDGLGEAADHLDSLPDGSGCFEIWEHLSETRERVAGD